MVAGEHQKNTIRLRLAKDMLRALGFVAHNGRYALVIGLIAGLLLPGVALSMRPWLPHMIIFLLFLTAFRVGVKATVEGFSDFHGALKITLIYQLAMPLVALGIFAAFGITATPFAIAILLMLTAPSLTGGPNITILLGHDPEPAFRILIAGTAVLPLTLIPVFLLSPDLGGLVPILTAALKLLAAIWVSVLLAFLARHLMSPHLEQDKTDAIDGFMAITLAVVVIGLMSALGPAIRTDPLLVLKWLVVAMVANLGLQTVTYYTLRALGKSKNAVPFAVVAGNRNFALFLIALPAATTEPPLIFLGCYQVPMYLSPILMKFIYQSKSNKKNGI